MTEPDVSPKYLRQLRGAAAKEGKLDAAVLEEIANLDEEHRLYVFRPESRCKVCVSESSDVVNKMLAHAMTYQDIYRSLEPLNKILPASQRITYDSIWTHAKKHFPIEQAAGAVYRRLVERRAEEYKKDFVNGVGGALTPMAYLDVVQQKGFENLVDDKTVVSVETGMRAAERLHQLSREDDNRGNDVAETMLKLQRVIEAVKAHVPEDIWPQIIAAVEKAPSTDIVDAETVDLAEDSTAYDPDDPDFGDDADDIGVLDDGE